MKFLGRDHVFMGHEFLRSKRDGGWSDSGCELEYPFWISVSSVYGGCWKGRKMLEELIADGSNAMYLYEFAEFEKGELLPELAKPKCYNVKNWGIDTRTDEFVQFYIDNHNYWYSNKMTLYPPTVICPKCGGRVVKVDDGYETKKKCFECGYDFTRTWRER